LHFTTKIPKKTEVDYLYGDLCRVTSKKILK